MHLFPDFRDLLEAFVASGVEFVLIGGYAVIFHGRPRATKDLDLFVGIDDANRQRLAQALETFGAPANVSEAARNLAEGEVVFFGMSPLRVDLLATASGVGATARSRGLCRARAHPRQNENVSELRLR